MSEKETLQIAIAIADKFSPVIRDMQRQLQAMTVELKKTHATGRVGVEAHSRSIQYLKQDLDSIGRAAKSTVIPALGAMGIAVGGVAVAIATVTKITVGWGESVQKWNQLSATSGFPVQMIRVLESLSEYAGSTKEEMDGTIGQFGLLMKEFRNHRGEFYVALQNAGLKGQALSDKMLAAHGNAEALDAAMDGLKNGGFDAVLQGVILKWMGMNEKMASVIDRYPELKAEFNKAITPLGEGAAKKADDLVKARQGLRDAMNNTWAEAGEEFAPQFTKFLKETKEFITDNGPAIKGMIGDIAKGIEGAVHHLERNLSRYAAIVEIAASDDPMGLLASKVRKKMGIGTLPLIKPAYKDFRLEGFGDDRLPGTPGGVPSHAAGGNISKTGLALIHRGETITPADSSSRSKNDAVDIIAVGTRKGVYDGMIDFQQYLNGEKGGSFMRASFGTGAGGSGTGPGGGAGGAPGGIGGSGGRGGAHGGADGDIGDAPAAPADDPSRGLSPTAAGQGTFAKIGAAATAGAAIVGNPSTKSGRIAIAKAAMQDQLRKEGVPEAHLEEASNLLVGQALSESANLNPAERHDGNVGLGISPGMSVDGVWKLGPVATRLRVKLAIWRTRPCTITRSLAAF
jgi:hypothetical protein